MDAQTKPFAICIDNRDYQASLVLGRSTGLFQMRERPRMIWCESSTKVVRT